MSMTRTGLVFTAVMTVLVWSAGSSAVAMLGAPDRAESNDIKVPAVPAVVNPARDHLAFSVATRQVGGGGGGGDRVTPGCYYSYGYDGIGNRTRLPDLLEFARKRRALVFYADESLISLIPHVGKTWTFPAAHPIVRVSGKRGQHVGITAAVKAELRQKVKTIMRETKNDPARVASFFLP